jgi:iron(III) transport system substrate-binding protein
MKKVLFGAALLVAVVALFGVACSKPKATGAADGLGKELVLYSSMTENDLSNLLKGFNAKYPDIKVEVVNGSAGELLSRINAESGNPQGDVMWGGINSTDGDTYAGIFEPWLSDFEGEILQDHRSPNGYVNLDHLSTTVFCVNTDLEKELGITIDNYADLLNPKLKGRIVFSDPNSSSAAWNNVSNIMAVFGYDSPASWTYIENLMRNDLIVVTSSSVCFKAVADGEYVAGLTYEDGAATLLKSGAKNVKLVYPSEGTSALALGCALIKGAPHQAAGKAMINYLMSADGQSQLATALGTLRFTNSKAVYETPYLKKTSDVKWVPRDINWLITNKAKVLEHWNTLYASIKR